MKVGDRVALTHPKAMGRIGQIVGETVYEIHDEHGNVVARSCTEFTVQMEGRRWCWQHWRWHIPVYGGLSADQLVLVKS